MPKLKISHIISFSSEDPNFPASNLLKSENYKKWKCKTSGEKEATVLLQLDKAEKITSIDIGNEGSAFVEVFVKRSSQTVDEFKVLLLTSSFMSPLESRNFTNTNRVRMFSADKLDKSTIMEKWDVVKIVCTQPFNKHVQYGLSFVTLYSESEKEPPKNQITFGGFTLKDEKKDDIKPGCLFADFKEKHLGFLKGAAAIREASTSEGIVLSKAQSETRAFLKEIEQKKKNDLKNEMKRELTTNNDASSSRKNIEADIIKTVNKDKNATNGKGISKNSTKDIKENVKEMNQKKGTRKRKSSLTNEDESPMKRMKVSESVKKEIRKPFNKLFGGVVFVISGFQNPLRGEIRSKALEMGAKYKPDWENSCTHLICAFPNTPKYMQVLGKGHIVSKDWIEESHSKRRRLPWRRYAMAKHEKGKEESEEEILEDTDEMPSNDQELPDVISNAERGAPSGSDTDDEIQRCMEESIKSEKTPEKNIYNSRDSDCYDCVTEEDESEYNELSTENGKLPLVVPDLPHFFSGFIFYIHPEVDSQTRYELNRHIVAFKGKVNLTLNDEVTHIIYADKEKVPINRPGIKHLHIQWIWDCVDAEEAVPMTKNYLVNQKTKF